MRSEAAEILPLGQPGEEQSVVTNMSSVALPGLQVSHARRVFSSKGYKEGHKTQMWEDRESSFGGHGAKWVAQKGLGLDLTGSRADAITYCTF